MIYLSCGIKMSLIFYATLLFKLFACFYVWLICLFDRGVSVCCPEGMIGGRSSQFLVCSSFPENFRNRLVIPIKHESVATKQTPVYNTFGNVAVI